MGRCSVLGVVVLLVGQPVWAQALDGAWRVEGRTERALRSLEREGDLLRLRLRHPVLGALDLTGGQIGDGLVMTGARERRRRVGAAGRVRGQRGRAPKPESVRLVGRRSGEGALAVEFQVGEQRLKERWVRPAGRIELLSIEPSVFDPKRGKEPLRIRFAVRGVPSLKVQLGVLLPQEDGAKSARWGFYHGGKPPKVPAGTPVYRRDLGTLAEGEHTVTWNGRDRIDGRIVLAGSYRVSLRSPTAGKARGELRIADPHLSTLAAYWPKTRHRSSTTTYGAPTARTLAAFLGDAPRRTCGRFQTHVNASWTRPEAFYQALQGSSVVYATTHGGRRGLALQSKPIADDLRLPRGQRCNGRRGGGCDDVCYRERKRTGWISSTSLQAALPLAPGETLPLPGEAQVKRPLDDVLFVVLYACETGRGALPRKLRRLGVDCVISFRTKIASAQKEDWIRRFAETLLSDYQAGVQSVARAAAVVSDAEFWTDHRIRQFRDAGVRARKLEPVMHVLPDRYDLPLFPARYGAPGK